MSGGQYELKRQTDTDDRKSQSGLELNVIDHYNGSERSVKTLSGGNPLKLLFRWHSDFLMRSRHRQAESSWIPCLSMKDLVHWMKSHWNRR